jgi:hypothetical protein
MTSKKPLEVEKGNPNKVLIGAVARHHLKPFDERIDDMIASVSSGKF